MSTNLEYRARERQRKRESGREAQREKGRQGFRGRDEKPKETFFCWKRNMKILCMIIGQELENQHSESSDLIYPKHSI